MREVGFVRLYDDPPWPVVSSQQPFAKRSSMKSPTSETEVVVLSDRVSNAELLCNKAAPYSMLLIYMPQLGIIFRTGPIFTCYIELLERINYM